MGGLEWAVNRRSFTSAGATQSDQIGVAIKMAYSLGDALDMILDGSPGAPETEEESDIEEDPAFPFPQVSDTDSDCGEGLYSNKRTSKQHKQYQHCTHMNKEYTTQVKCFMATAGDEETHSHPVSMQPSPVLLSPNMPLQPPPKQPKGFVQSSILWQDVMPDIDISPASPAFHDVQGSSLQLGAEAAPVEFFRTFFDDEVLDMVVTETNR